MKSFIIKYIQDLRKSQLVKVSSKNAPQVILQFVVGLFKIKLISIWLGASGMTLLSQFENLFQLGANISSGGISQGITKLVAISNKEDKKSLFSTSIVIISSISLLLSAALFFFSSYFAVKLMYDGSFSIIFKYSGIFIFLSTIANISKAALKGEKRHRDFIRTNMIEVLAGFSLVALGAYHSIQAAVMCTMIAASTIGLYTLVKFPYFRLPIHFSKPMSKRLSGFSLMFIVAALIAPLLQIILRSIIIQECSLDEAGWWDGIRRISRTYTSLIITTISLYILPRISEIKNNRALSLEIKKSLKTILPFVGLGCLAIFLGRNIIIKVLFSEEFEGMKGLFLFQCGADFLKIIAWLLATVLIMREKIKSYIFSEIFMFIFSISINYLMISKWGIEVSTLTSFISTSVYVLLLILLWRKNLKS